MYKLILGIAFGLVLFSSSAIAACSSYPYTLTNGTTADATQVMANFNCAALTTDPSFSGSLTVNATSTNPMVSLFDSTAAGAGMLLQSSSGSASLELNGGTGHASEIYSYLGGTIYWASGLTGGGITSYSFYNYPNSQNVLVLLENGNATLAGCLTYNGGTLGTCLSDVRTKRNVAPFRMGLLQIAALTPVTYEYNGLGETAADGKVRTGLVAQDVEAVAPELVQATNTKLDHADRASKPLLAVRYGDLTFALINAVKELKATNDNQSAEIERLESKVAGLERKLGTRTAQR